MQARSKCAGITHHWAPVSLLPDRPASAMRVVPRPLAALARAAQIRVGRVAVVSPRFANSRMFALLAGFTVVVGPALSLLTRTYQEIIHLYWRVVHVCCLSGSFARELEPYIFRQRVLVCRRINSRMKSYEHRLMDKYNSDLYANKHYWSAWNGCLFTFLNTE